MNQTQDFIKNILINSNCKYPLSAVLVLIINILMIKKFRSCTKEPQFENEFIWLPMKLSELIYGHTEFILWTAYPFMCMSVCLSGLL